MRKSIIGICLIVLAGCSLPQWRNPDGSPPHIFDYDECTSVGYRLNSKQAERDCFLRKGMIFVGEVK